MVKWVKRGGISLGGFMGCCRREGINIWIKGRGNTAVKLKQGRRGRGGGRAGDYVGGGRAKGLIPPSQLHQEGGRVATAASWVHISSGVDYAVTVQNVGGGGLLGMRDGGSGSGGDDIYGRGGMKGCVSRREDVRGGVGVGSGGGGVGGVDGGVGVHSWTSRPGEIRGGVEPPRALSSVRHKRRRRRPGNSGVGGRGIGWLACARSRVSAPSPSTPSTGTAAAFWPACQVWTRDGREAEALPAIV